MNHKQKLGYMALGAGILALGIIIGQWGTPDIEAQSNGVFDEITCRSLKVVDETGVKVSIGVNADGGFIKVDDKDRELQALIGSTEHGGHVSVYRGLAPGATMGMTSHGGIVSVWGKGSAAAVMQIEEDGGEVTVIGKEAEGLVGMGINESGKGVVFTWDSNGYRFK